MAEPKPDIPEEVVEQARQIAYCTCGPELPEKMRKRGDHFSNCHTDLIDDIAEALHQARLDAFREAVEAAEKMASKWRNDGAAAYRDGRREFGDNCCGRANSLEPLAQALRARAEKEEG